MRGPKPSALCLDPSVRQALETFVRRHSTPQQKARRGRIVLLAADGYNNAQIARELGLDPATARYWRERWRQSAQVPLDDLALCERFADRPRPGSPARITAEQWGHLTALACEPPSSRGVPSATGLAASWPRKPKSGVCSRRSLPDMWGDF
jgi:transposase-like protein